MTTLNILTNPDTRLNHKSQVVEKIDQSLKKIIDHMFETLYASGNGIGLAAPQVGVKKRIVVIDIKKDDVSNPVAFVNPKITKFEDSVFTGIYCDSFVTKKYLQKLEDSRQDIKR